MSTVRPHSKALLYVLANPVATSTAFSSHQLNLAMVAATEWIISSRRDHPEDFFDVYAVASPVEEGLRVESRSAHILLSYIFTLRVLCQCCKGA